jgi:tRNA (cytidine32/uridine32-2'-O)-methyltransferase
LYGVDAMRGTLPGALFTMMVPCASPPVVTAKSLRFVLFEPSHPGNVGATARAMKTMGFDQLCLVNPACEIDGEARARSAGALDILANARVCATLAEAVADCGYVVGASARRRRLNWPELNPRECAAEIAGRPGGDSIAILFGPERAGLTNAELDLCSALVYIPSNPEYNSLNLASAVQLIAYELRLAVLTEEPAPAPDYPPATAREMALFYEHLERALLATEFLDAGNPRHLMRRLRRLFNRSQLDQNELNILRGMLSALAPGSGDRPARDEPVE